MKRRLFTFLLLMAAWLAWSGLFTPLLIGFGVLSCVLVVILTDRMGFYERDLRFFRILHRVPAYWAWFGLEILKSNVAVVRIVLSPRLRISPTLVRVDALARDPIGRATFGNSMTLTPGTVTIDHDDGRFTVHCLTREAAEDLAHGEMNRRVAALSG